MRCYAQNDIAGVCAGYFRSAECRAIFQIAYKRIKNSLYSSAWEHEAVGVSPCAYPAPGTGQRANTGGFPYVGRCVYK